MRCCSCSSIHPIRSIRVQNSVFEPGAETENAVPTTPYDAVLEPASRHARSALPGTRHAFSTGMRAVPISAIRIGALLVVTLIVAGCGSPPKLDKQLETLSSWAATMQLARDEHGSGAITTTYATQLRAAARTALQQSERTIGQAAHSKVDSSYAAAALDSLRTAIRQLNAETGS